MNKKKKQFIRGIGSIINVWPSTRYDEIIPKQSVEQRVQNSWFRVRAAFEKSLKDFQAYEKQTKTI